MHKFTFKKIRAKNFRSIGNAFMELDYLASPSTLIASLDNGAGKSTLSIFAPYYALFGKSYQKSTKIGGLINSRSNKDSVVELEFETKGSSWMVRRGQKPALLEIWQDGVMLENEAAAKDPQAVLQGIIGFDEKAFNSVIALGVNRFVPFTEFTAQERRVFVESMLDLIIISSMNTLTKERIKAIKKVMEQLFYEIGILESKISGRKRTLQILNDKKQQRLAESGSELDGFNQEKTAVTAMQAKCTEKLAELQAAIIPDAETRQSQTKTMLDRFKMKADSIQRNADSVIHLADCPTCKQSVTEDHKSAIKAAADKEMADLTGPMAKLTADLAAIAELVQTNVDTRTKMGVANVLQVQLDGRLRAAQNSINAIQAKMVDSGEDKLIENEQTEIALLDVQIATKTEELNSHKKEETKHTQFLQVLADDGVKSKIVEQYTPFLVSSINTTLDKLNLYLNIDIDADFNITMNTPTRKNQTLEGLSTGQLRRIDLAVLLAWREIASKKASVDTNILILDEILENLSATGVNEFMDMWLELSKDTNLFVISQRHAEFEQYFDTSIVYKLVDDQTILVEVED
jgi:DNA repair exonuclease SbcCD ATPase subunit